MCRLWPHNGKIIFSKTAEQDFPLLPEGEPSHTFQIAPKAFSRLIEQTAFAISAEETRYYLNGIFLHTLTVDGADVLRAF